jgi:IS5 family transposase
VCRRERARELHRPRQPDHEACRRWFRPELQHTVVTTAANVNDVTQAHALLHSEETHAFGDAGYTGVTKREENEASKVTWHVANEAG